MKKTGEGKEAASSELQTIRRNVELGMQVYSFSCYEQPDAKDVRIKRPVFLFDEATREQALAVVNLGLAALISEMTPEKRR